MLKNLTYTVLVTALAAVSAAQGASITWTFENVTFSDGGTLNGSFTVDVSAGEPTGALLSDLDMTSTAGSLEPGYHYTYLGAINYVYDDELGGSAAVAEGVPTDPAGFSPDIEISEGSQVLNLLLADPLTDAGGTIAIVPPAVGQTDDESFEFDGTTRYVTGGSITAEGRSTPEPGTWMLVVTPLLISFCKGRRFRMSRYERASAR